MRKIHEYLGMIVRNAQVLEQHLAYIVANDVFVKKTSTPILRKDFEKLIEENNQFLKDLLYMPLGDLLEQADKNKSVSRELLGIIDKNRIGRNFAVHKLFKLSDDLSWAEDNKKDPKKDEMEKKLKTLVDETYQLERRLIELRNALAHKYNDALKRYVKK